MCWKCDNATIRTSCLDEEELSEFELAEREVVLREMEDEFGGIDGFLEEIEVIGELERDIRNQKKNQL